MRALMEEGRDSRGLKRSTSSRVITKILARLAWIETTITQSGQIYMNVCCLRVAWIKTDGPLGWWVWLSSLLISRGLKPISEEIGAIP